MGSDRPEDEEESTSIHIDASMTSDITITRTGMSPVTAHADTATPADHEPLTLEPQLGIRGLAPRDAFSSSAPSPATVAEVRGRQDSETDYESEEERTTQNLESHVQGAYDQAMTSAARAAFKTQLSPIVLTPSEPIRLDAVRSALGTLEQRRPAPIPAAGRPPEQDLDRESAVTAKRGPEKIESLGAVATARPIADTEDYEDYEDYEEETKTDAVQSAIVAASRGRAETRPVPEVQQHPALEPDETRTKKAPFTLMSAQAAFMMDDPPRREPVVAESAPPDLDAQAGAGGTVRMFFNPTTGQATVHPDSERRVVGHYPMQPFGEQPTVQALPVQQIPAMPAPATVRNPAAQDETHEPRRMRRRVMPLVVLFFVACAALGAAVLLRGPLVPWISARLPVGWGPLVAPSTSASSVPDPSASASAASVDAVPTAAPTASASPVPAAPTTGTASASATTPSSAALSASAAAASASAQRNGKSKHLPTKK